MTTREKEILEAITEQVLIDSKPMDGKEIDVYSTVFSSEKLATYLAELEAKISKYTT